MKTARFTRLMLAILVTFAAVPTWAAQTAARTPTEAYLAYRRAAAEAKMLSEMYPHISAAWKKNLQSLSKDRQPRFLESFTASSKQQDMKITKESITGSTCVLEGTAKNASGFPLKGKVTMVKEGGEWKVDEEGWGTTGDAPQK